jgi:hypothetical protein
MPPRRSGEIKGTTLREKRRWLFRDWEPPLRGNRFLSNVPTDGERLFP